MTSEKPGLVPAQSRLGWHKSRQRQNTSPGRNRVLVLGLDKLSLLGTSDRGPLGGRRRPFGVIPGTQPSNVGSHTFFHAGLPAVIALSL